jgi:hypothetical protein
VTGALTLVALAGLFLGSTVWAAMTDMFKDEVRTRLDRLPYLLIRAAVLRIPRADRADLTAEWEAELDAVLHGTDGLPLTRLLRGIWFSADLLLRGAPAVAREINAARGEARWSLTSRTHRSQLSTWANLFPQGREIFYEGEDPAGFASQIQAEFGFSPSPRPSLGRADRRR